MSIVLLRASPRGFGGPVVFAYLYDMKMRVSIEAQLMWQLIYSGADGLLEAPQQADYCGMLERMEAVELLALMEKVQERLRSMGMSVPGSEAMPMSSVPADRPSTTPVELYIDKQYTIRMGAPDGRAMPLRPLVKALFILFLRHPEGILLKQRDLYRQELEEIYAAICPNAAIEDVRARVERLTNPQDNSFSEKASVLNARLEELLPAGTAEEYKIQGYNGHPRRIPLNPLSVHWELCRES